MGGSKRKRNGRRNRAGSEVTHGGGRLVVSDPGPPQYENGNDDIGDPKLELGDGGEVAGKIENKSRSVNTTSLATPPSHNSNSTGGSTKFHWALKAEKDVHADLKRPIIQTNEEAEVLAREEATGIIMPPWSIYLVGLGDEHKFEHVDIPGDIEYSYVVVPNNVKAVAVGTVVGLLRQIAGLTSIAMKKSLAARDALLRIKEEHTRQIDAKRDEIENLKKLVEEGRANQTCDDQPKTKGGEDMVERWKVSPKLQFSSDNEGVLELGGPLCPTSKVDGVKMKSLPTGFSSEGEFSDDDDSGSDRVCGRGQV